MRQDPARKDWTWGQTALKGQVMRVVRDRGFAFIKAGEHEYFMHAASYTGNFDQLKEGHDVTFTPVDTPKGKRAEDASRAGL